MKRPAHRARKRTTVNVPQIIDLSGLVTVLASSGVVSVALQWLRDIALDSLTTSMAEKQRNALYRALLVLLNFAAIVGLALLSGTPLGAVLLVSAALAAFGGAAGSHVVFTYVQKQRASDAAGFTAPASPVSSPDGSAI